MMGYHKDKPATNKAFAKGWFHTGDLAVMSPDGYVRIKDRSKDIIQRRFLSEDKVTLHDLAAEYSISAERVRQIENGALKKLKAFMSDAA